MSDQTQPTVDLRHYLQVLWRRQLIILVVVIVVPAIVLAFSLTRAAVYEATARVMVEGQQPALDVVAGSSLSGGSVDVREVATLANFVATPEVAQKVQQQLSWSMTTHDLMASITTVPNTDANIIDITASQPTAARAATLANAVAVQFVAWRQQSQQAALASAVTLTTQQIGATPRGSADYQALLARRNQLETLKALTGGGVTIGEQAQAPTAPTSPRPKRDTALALAAALVLGVGLAFLREALDVKIHTLDDLQQLASVPIITTIAELPKEFRRNGKLITLEDPRSPVSEAYRVLRTNLEFMNFNHDLQAILVTSPLPGQGKSTTIANLAVVLLKAGKRVALVEGDLRRPSLHSYFSVPNDVGLTSVVAGIVPLNQAMRVLTLRETSPALTTATARPKGGDPSLTGGAAGPSLATRRETLTPTSDGAMTGLRLRLLTSGPLPPNPGEIVTSQQLSDLLTELRRDNDYVLVDAPPMLAVGDAGVLAGKVDGVLVIVRIEETTRQQMAEIDRFLERVPARSLGIVAAGVTRSGRKGYTRYHEYYG